MFKSKLATERHAERSQQCITIIHLAPDSQESKLSKDRRQTSAELVLDWSPFCCFSLIVEKRKGEGGGLDADFDEWMNNENEEEEEGKAAINMMS